MVYLIQYYMLHSGTLAPFLILVVVVVVVVVVVSNPNLPVYL